MSKLSRRDALRWLAGGGLAAAVPGAILNISVFNTFEPLSARLSRFFTNTSSACAIGRRYLALKPQEADPRLLAALVSRTPENYLALVNADSRRVRELLLAQQKRDFECGQIVKINGWILSETEVRLCAIVTIV